MVPDLSFKKMELVCEELESMCFARSAHTNDSLFMNLGLFFTYLQPWLQEQAEVNEALIVHLGEIAE